MRLLLTLLTLTMLALPLWTNAGELDGKVLFCEGRGSVITVPPITEMTWATQVIDPQLNNFLGVIFINDRVEYQRLKRLGTEVSIISVSGPEPWDPWNDRRYSAEVGHVEWWGNSYLNRESLFLRTKRNLALGMSFSGDCELTSEASMKGKLKELQDKYQQQIDDKLKGNKI